MTKSKYDGKTGKLIPEDERPRKKHRNFLEDLPIPNRAEKRKYLNARTTRPDESPYTKPSKGQRRRTNRVKNRLARAARMVTYKRG